MNIKDIITDREMDVLACLLNGRSVKKSASLLRLSPKTVETYIRHLMLKLQCNSRDQLTDIVTNANLLYAFHQHYIGLLGKDLQLSNQNIVEIQKNGRPLFFLFLCLILFILSAVILIGYLKSTHQHLKDNFLLPNSANLLKRTDLLQEIASKFNQDRNIQTIILVGAGGSGKTTLARSYALQYDQGLAWEINANTKENILLSFEKLVLAMLHQDHDIKGLEVLQKLFKIPQYETVLLLFAKEKLLQRPNWLLIFDNVDNFKEVQNYLPNDSKIWGQGKVLITTTDANLSSVYPSITIKELTEQEKISIFSKILPFRNANAHLIKSFLTNIPPFPLDVLMAAHYLKTTTISYKEYLEKMIDDVQLHQLQQSILNDVGNYTKTRYNIICLSIKNLLQDNQNFGELLLFLSLLDSQNIPRQLLNNYKNRAIVDNFLYALQKHSLLHDPGILKLHMATQEIMRSYMTQLLEFKNQPEKIDAMVMSLSNYVDQLMATQNLQSLLQILPHLLSFLKHEQFLSKIARADLNIKVASIYIKRQINQQRSRKLLQESRLIYEDYYPSAHPKIAWTLGQLGVLSKFDYQQQKCFFEESLKRYQQYYGEKNAFEYAWLWVYFGNFHRRIGKYTKSEELLRKSLSIYEDYYGPNHIQTAWILANLGRFYRHIGDQKQAKILFERCLKIHDAYASGNIIEYAWVMINLGIVHHNIGNLQQAKQLIDKGLEIYTNHYNVNDYELCWALIHKTFVDASITGDWLSAKETISQNIAVFMKSWGEGNIATAWALERLVRVYINLNDFVQAQKLLQQVLDIYCSKLGEHSVQVAFCKNYLGYIYFRIGNYKIAEHLFKSAIENLQNKKHPRLYIVLENLLNNYKAQQNLHTFIVDHYKTLFLNAVQKYLPPDSFLYINYAHACQNN